MWVAGLTRGCLVQRCCYNQEAVLRPVLRTAAAGDAGTPVAAESPAAAGNSLPASNDSGTSSSSSSSSSSSGDEPERPAGQAACSTSAAEAKAAPAAGGTAAPVDPPAAKPPKRGVAGAHAAVKGASRQRSRERPAKAAGQTPPQLTWAQVQKSLNIARLDRAAAALAALQEEAEQAGAASHWMHMYLVSAQAWLAVCRPDAVVQSSFKQIITIHVDN